MKNVSIAFLATVLSLSSLQNIDAQSKRERDKRHSDQRSQLVGTWRLISYSDFDSTTEKWIQPYGEHPLGYFTYTKGGIVNLNGSSQRPLVISEDSAKKRNFTLAGLLDNYAFGYFGTYTVDSKNSRVIHHPKGGAIPWYVGTDQYRQFIIKGDTLFIGDPTFTVGRRVLVREN